MLYCPRFLTYILSMTWKWANLVPVTLAERQERWEFGQTIRRMRKLGFKNKEIARRLNISQRRVSQAVKHPPMHARSPVERYMRETDEAQKMAQAAKPCGANTTMFQKRYAIWLDEHQRSWLTQISDLSPRGT